MDINNPPRNINNRYINIRNINNRYINIRNINKV